LQPEETKEEKLGNYQPKGGGKQHAREGGRGRGSEAGGDQALAPGVWVWEKNYRSKQKRKKQVNALFILSLSPPLHF
jgi:hypothetical protein